MTIFSKTTIRIALCVATLSWLTATASAQIILQERCNVDYLSTSQAEARLNWMWHCAQFDSGISDQFIYNGLTEYIEYSPNPFWGQNAYTGYIYNQGINTTFTNSLYTFWGNTTEYDYEGRKKWQKSVSDKKPRPLYPTFGTAANISNSTQLFPNTNNPNDCILYYDKAATQPALTGSFYVNGWCESSCYTPEQELLFSDGYRAIGEAIQELLPTMITLAPDSTLGDVQFQETPVYSYTRELRDSEHVIFELKMASGGELRVTAEHPVLVSTGRMVTAASLHVGDKLIRESGGTDSIVDIDRTTHFGKVYNIKPATNDLVSNVLVAQGYLVGSARYQNDDVGYINRVILGRAIPRDVLPE